MDRGVEMEKRPSPNFDQRPEDRAPDMLLLHYTGMESAEAALARLADPASKVSAHYLIDEDATLYQLVGEDQRAWHAGVASWAGETDINGCSIGIELQNPGHEFSYRDFPDAQMQALVALAQDIVARHAIPAARVLGHSDVAPGRKEDPGALFDWHLLADAGIGLWPENEFACGEALQLSDGDAVRAMQQKFRDFGYGIPLTGEYCAETRAVVTAFQSHWRCGDVTGDADRGTLAVLDALLAEIQARAG
ncbi:MAG: N-acetylmuramoyl-L-alanine amidase [Proteobacteria bacterium]|nr:N-acetylmuramoyl-L-alanine amidase [Pseudomonadota bacterium]